MARVAAGVAARNAIDTAANCFLLSQQSLARSLSLSLGRRAASSISPFAHSLRQWYSQRPDSTLLQQYTLLRTVQRSGVRLSRSTQTAELHSLPLSLTRFSLSIVSLQGPGGLKRERGREETYSLSILLLPVTHTYSAAVQRHTHTHSFLIHLMYHYATTYTTCSVMTVRVARRARSPDGRRERERNRERARERIELIAFAGRRHTDTRVLCLVHACLGFRLRFAFAFASPLPRTHTHTAQLFQFKSHCPKKHVHFLFDYYISRQTYTPATKGSWSCIL